MAWLWLGLAGTPHHLYPSVLQGTLRDQIRPVSQIRFRLTVECLKKSDGLGIEIGMRVPYTEEPRGTSRAYEYVDLNDTDYLIREKSP